MLTSVSLYSNMTISYSTNNTLEKVNESIYSLSCYGELVGQTGLFNLGMVTVLEGKLNLNLLNLVSHSACVEGLGKYIYLH